MTEVLAIDPPAAILGVVDRLHAAGHEAFLVGGCVRDRLIGRPVNDWDLTTDARPEEVMALFERTIPTGLRHGTVTVVVDGEPIETTTYRIEGAYSDGRRPDEVRFTRSIEEDLARRDFTINAMAWDPRRDAIVDPFDGRGDLDRGIIRAVRDPVERFDEDGLRALRAVRFACVLELEIAPTTWAALPATLDAFRRISVERVQIELAKMLVARRPGHGLRLLRESGLARVCLPPLAALADSVFARAVAAVDNVPPRLEVRAAAVFAAMPQAIGAQLRRLRFSNALHQRVARVIAGLGTPVETLTSDYSVRRFVSSIGPDVLDDVVAVARAWSDAPDRWDSVVARIECAGARRGPHAVRELAISGREVMDILGIPASRKVGELLDALLDQVWRSPEINSPDGLRVALLELVRKSK